MALQQLARGVDTFVAASWSGAGFGLAAELEVGVSFEQITAGLDQGAAGSIESLTFMPSAEGIVGGGDYGPLIVNCANSADAYIQNLGKVDLSVTAASASKVENIHTGGLRARTRCMDGQFDVASISAGRMSATGLVGIDDFYGLGGKSIVLYGTGGTLNNYYAMMGEHTLQRRADLIIVGHGAVLNLDPDIAVDWDLTTDAEILIHGGEVRWYGGDIPKITGLGGVIDFRFARRAIPNTLGATSFNVAGTRIYESDKVDLSNLVTLGAISRTNSGPTQFTGGFVPAP